jgi:hypothetical protein
LFRSIEANPRSSFATVALLAYTKCRAREHSGCNRYATARL